MKRKIIITVIALLVIIIAFAAKEGIRVYKYQKKAKALSIEYVDISKVKNGTYNGEYDLDYVNVKLSLIVKNGKLEGITILQHKNERGAEAEKEIPKRILANQTTKVDTISGATNSSKSIMKSVEIALQKGMN